MYLFIYFLYIIVLNTFLFDSPRNETRLAAEYYFKVSGNRRGYLFAIVIKQKAVLSSPPPSPPPPLRHERRRVTLQCSRFVGNIKAARSDVKWMECNYAREPQHYLLIGSAHVLYGTSERTPVDSSAISALRCTRYAAVCLFKNPN